MKTISKAKPPSSHAYPIGVEALAQSFGGCAERVNVRFECYPARLQSQGHAYRVISLECGTPETRFGASSEAVERGEFAPRCVITVAAIRRALKARVRELLKDVAITYYCKWLAAHPDAENRDLQLIDFHFDETNDALIGPNIRC